MPFAAPWMALAVTHNKWSKSETDREREWHTLYDIAYMQSLKNDINELIYKTETDSQTYRTNLWVLEGKGEG